jgi:hypothetical protein
MQQKTHGTTDQTALADGKNVKTGTADQTSAEQRPNS